MGYRSVVEVVMYPAKPEDFAMLKLYVEEHLPDEFEVKGDKRKVLHLRLDGVKWCDFYEEVEVYAQCFANWEDTFGNKCHYEFIRIGEDTGDIEHECSGDEYLLQVSTAIVNNF